jgi:hypothetical protein
MLCIVNPHPAEGSTLIVHYAGRVHESANRLPGAVLTELRGAGFVIPAVKGILQLSGVFAYCELIAAVQVETALISPDF